ncbi:hypothetical protein [Synechococcus sp. PCC 7336]|uniref:hypothetical protein n=1 Tax=Synechococcus sp. PCC 7336 TaxID=195250 RepID=UPI000345ADE5|nr:hypothetical protein [Synechococcus sp. PCC 7336]
MLKLIGQVGRAISKVFSPMQKTTVKVGFQSITADVCHKSDGTACHADDFPHNS